MIFLHVSICAYSRHSSYLILEAIGSCKRFAAIIRRILPTWFTHLSLAFKCTCVNSPLFYDILVMNSEYFDHCVQYLIVPIALSATGQGVECKTLIVIHPHPTLRSLDSNPHKFEVILTIFAHMFMLFVGVFLPFKQFCMWTHGVCTFKSHNKLCRT